MAIQQVVSVPKHRTAKGAQRIQSLVEVAAQLFLERGFEAVSVDDLIALVGGSRSNVYRHFGGKEGLFEAAMLYLCAEVAKPIERLSIEGRNVDEVLSTFGRVLIQTALSPRTLGLHRLLTIEGGHFPDIAQAMWSVSYQKVIDLLAGWMTRHQEVLHHSLSSEVPARILAEQFVSMVTSDVKLRAIVGLIRLPLSEAESDSIVRHAVHTFLYGACGNQAEPTQPVSRTKSQ